MIHSFSNFINEEFSKNDPIPEITRINNKLGIILLGAPGSGKSTFANNFIFPKNRNIKNFSTDDVSLMYTKDSKKYHQGASELNINRLIKYISSGNNFIYDTTGAQDKNVFNICKSAKENGYKIIFIQVIVDLNTSKSRNIQRGKNGGHQVDEDYIDFVYSRQFKNISDYSKHLNPDNFYIIFNNTGKYKFYKYESGKLLKRKVDKYLPIKENLNGLKGIRAKERIDFLWDFFTDIKDDGLEVKIFKFDDASLYSGKFKQYIVVEITDIDHVYDPESHYTKLNLSDMDQIKYILNWLKSMKITPRSISSGGNKCRISFDR